MARLRPPRGCLLPCFLNHIFQNFEVLQAVPNEQDGLSLKKKFQKR
jgi:hypothetical protein